jgi:hypothetical protein
MFQDYKDLLSAFHAHGVKYLIVGGYAVIFHAQPRFTNDLDLFIKADAANARATYAALAELGAPLPGLRGRIRHGGGAMAEPWAALPQDQEACRSRSYKCELCRRRDASFVDRWD